MILQFVISVHPSKTGFDCGLEGDDDPVPRCVGSTNYTLQCLFSVPHSNLTAFSVDLPGCRHLRYFSFVCSDWMCNIKAVCDSKLGPRSGHDFHSQAREGSGPLIWSIAEISIVWHPWNFRGSVALTLANVTAKALLQICQIYFAVCPSAFEGVLGNYPKPISDPFHRTHCRYQASEWVRLYAGKTRVRSQVCSLARSGRSGLMRRMRISSWQTRLQYLRLSLAY